jgi:hypothetical protein
MVIIIPCAGLSSRFPKTLPKYLLSCFDGEMVLEKVLKQYDAKYPIYVTILKEHDEKYNVTKRLKYTFGDRITIVTLENRTKGAAETVYRTIKLLNFKNDTSFIVRDCDSFFDHEIKEFGNYVYCEHINNGKNLPGKSYVEINNQNIIVNIIEKKIVSEHFCVGGYQFDSVGEYKKYFESLTVSNNELYISEIIGNMINDKLSFVKMDVVNYSDVGTINEFREYNDKPTYFCDIDGVICKDQSRYDDKPFENYVPIKENVEVLLKKLNDGCQVVFTTARDFKYVEQTKKMLEELGFKGCNLLMNVHRSRRVVINDFSDYYPTCEAVCIETESANLQKMLK